MDHMPVEEYLNHALKIKPEEEILRQRAAEWLPDQIIDCHSHCNLKTHVNFVSDRAYGHMLSTFTYFALEDSIGLHQLFYPNRTVHTLRFPKTFEGIDHRAANDYLLSMSPEEDRVAVFGLPEDPKYTFGIMHHPRATALKMYWSYVNPPAKKIYEFFTPDILEEAQALNLPIILHLPRSIVYTCDDLMALLSDFPRLKVVLAHLGLSKMLVPGLEEAYQRAAASENVWMDTALNPSPDVMSLALKHFGKERIMYGSDEPLNLIRSTAFTHPEKGERIVTDYPYHWTDTDERTAYGHLAAKAVHAQWQCMDSIHEAAKRRPTEKDEILEKVFFQNAKDFFRF